MAEEKKKPKIYLAVEHEDGLIKYPLEDVRMAGRKIIGVVEKSRDLLRIKTSLDGGKAPSFKKKITPVFEEMIKNSGIKEACNKKTLSVDTEEFKCSSCGEKFSTKDKLKSHERACLG